MKFFAKILHDWYPENKRDLPWRNTLDPYLIYLSEVILQQTRVDQGLPYYNEFSLRFPTVDDLALAEEEEVLKMWQGLGYYSRARNLHKAAKIVASKGEGFPMQYDELIKLPGIGPYAAAAISSFSSNEAKAVVDGNVYRVLSRVFGIDTPIDTGKGQKEFMTLAQELLDEKNAGDYNQAIMEFGALQCTPKKPRCASCPFETKCEALAKNSIDVLPVKAKKIKRSKRYFLFLEIKNERGDILMEQRGEKDIWAKMYQPPLLELSEQEFNAGKTFLNGMKVVFPPMSFKKHVLSHQDIIHFVQKCDLSEAKLTIMKPGLAYYSKEELLKLPIPKMLETSLY